MVIYKITNKINNRFYIGRAMNFDRRKADHIRRMNKSQSHCTKLQNAWKKYGQENFVFEILENVTDKGKIIEREQYYLDTLKPYYNLSASAVGSLGSVRSEEATRKTAESSRKRILQYDLERNYLREWDSLTECSKKLDLNLPHISMCCAGKRKSVGGFKFQYKDNPIDYTPKHTKEEVSKILSKLGEHNYEITFPNNSIQIIRNLKNFCKDNDLTYSCMIKVGNGERSHHKHFKLKRLGRAI